MKTILLIMLAFTYATLEAQVVQKKKLTPSTPVEDGRFGNAVAIDGDIAAIGTYWDDNSSVNNGGAVYIYYRNQGGADNWGEVKKIIPSDPASNKEFGWQVHIENNMLVVDAIKDNNDRGSVYIYYKDEGGTDNWGEIKKITASDATVDDEFGVDVIIKGNTLAVGSHTNSSKGSDAGAVYIFDRNQGGTDNWGEIKKITASDAQAGALFGHSVDIEGDILVVGAYHDPATEANGGAAYIFDRNQGGTDNWGEVKKIIASPVLDGDRFGFDVDLDGDNLAISAWLHNHSGVNNAGAVYIHQKNEGGSNNWGEKKKITLASPSLLDRFGGSLVLQGDKLLIGAEGADFVGANNAGSAYIFERNEGGTDNWGLVQQLSADDRSGLDRFGRRVAMSGDYIIIGSYFADYMPFSGLFEDPGATYVFGLNIPLNSQSIRLKGERLNTTEVLLEWEAGLREEAYKVEILYSTDGEDFERLASQDLYGFHNTRKVLKQEKSGYFKIRATHSDTRAVNISNLVFVDSDKVSQTAFFPNPFQNFLNFQTDLDEDITLQVYNSQGKLIVRYEGDSEYLNDFLLKSSSTWAKGLYIIKLTTGKAFFQRTVLKQ